MCIPSRQNQFFLNVFLIWDWVHRWIQKANYILFVCLYVCVRDRGLMCAVTQMWRSKGFGESVLSHLLWGKFSLAAVPALHTLGGLAQESLLSDSSTPTFHLAAGMLRSQMGATMPIFFNMASRNQTWAIRFVLAILLALIVFLISVFSSRNSHATTMKNVIIFLN